MASKTYKCPNCGAALEFDASDGTVDCAYCLSEFTVPEVEEYNKRITEQLAQNDTATEAEHRDYSAKGIPQTETRSTESTASNEKLHSYNCDSCGAEVICNENTSATYCYYCHQPVVLTDRVSGKFKPDKLLPFKITRDEAVSRFLKWCEGKRYLPSDFTSDSHLEKMTGVYLPVWLAEVENSADFRGQAVQRTRMDSRRESIDTYEIGRTGKLTLKNMMEIAFSSSDKISPEAFETIANFGWEDLQDFSAVYLSGFFSELWSIGPEDAAAQAEDKAQNYVSRAISNELNMAYQNVSLSKAEVQPKLTNLNYVLAPAWVLTYKFHKKIYLYVMNGQHGQIYGELPMDNSRVFRTAAIIFLVLLISLLLGGKFLW